MRTAIMGSGLVLILKIAASMPCKSSIGCFFPRKISSSFNKEVVEAGKLWAVWKTSKKLGNWDFIDCFFFSIANFISFASFF